ncbi:outer membrane protein transport protein [Vannielia sp.]|uniref:OmpP1/FadL family transporter n=1 Tax=Vannielia sp. TaxID=2813045 RepID=UPI00261FBC5F|nr:outer membrane protein transport protein [Vannielia sp.]MDF1873200.1 outer membrane protein transport protein [Vannielia sp.]
MNKVLCATAALLATTATVQAGGIERTTQSLSWLFETGSYGEFSYSMVDADVSGVVSFAPSVSSKDMIASHRTVGFAFKTDLNEKFSLGVAYEQPFGADVFYPTGTGYPYAGSHADLNADEIKAVLQYNVDSNWSVYGGLRFQNVKGDVTVLAPGVDYTLDVAMSTKLGYLIGVAYERPEIAMRIALTYNSAIKHEFDATEIGILSTNFETEFPQSVNLEGQTGIAEGTLLMGSVRWVNWSAFDITPDLYSDGAPDGNFGPRSLVDYADDTITYSLGVARSFTDNFAGIATISYEKSNGGFSGNLGPTDGRTSIGLAGRYSVGKATITGGVNYSWIGDAETENAAAPGTTLGDFSDNTALGVGIRVGYTF